MIGLKNAKLSLAFWYWSCCKWLNYSSHLPPAFNSDKQELCEIRIYKKCTCLGRDKHSLIDFTPLPMLSTAAGLPSKNEMGEIDFNGFGLGAAKSQNQLTRWWTWIHSILLPETVSCWQIPIAVDAEGLHPFTATSLDSVVRGFPHCPTCSFPRGLWKTRMRLLGTPFTNIKLSHLACVMMAVVLLQKFSRHGFFVVSTLKNQCLFQSCRGKVCNRTTDFMPWSLQIKNITVVWKQVIIIVGLRHDFLNSAPLIIHSLIPSLNHVTKCYKWRYFVVHVWRLLENCTKRTSKLKSLPGWPRVQH